MKVEKLAIGFPWVSPFIWTQTVDSLLNLRRPDNSRFFRGRGWCPARRHLDICEMAVEWGASHILILGADQVYEEDMIERLISRVEDDNCEVISALVPTRGCVPRMDMVPFQPMAWRFKANTDFRQYRGYEEDGDMIEVIKPENGDLQEIDFIGSGVIMFPVDDLLMLPKPWFSETFDEETMAREASMDTKFCFKLKVISGAKLWVDTSILVRHLNVMEIDRSYQERFLDWQDVGYGEQKHVQSVGKA